MTTRILFVITGLQTGGAEIMLRSLLEHLDRAYFLGEVVSLREPGAVGRQMQGMGVTVHTLDMSAQRPSPAALLKLAGILRQFRPHVVQTWMYHADLFGSLAALFAGRPPLVWGIHHAGEDLQALKPATRRIIQLNARLSQRMPERIVCCSMATLETHAQMGYARSKMVFIPNGFDLQRFTPDAQAAARFRQEIGVAAETPLVGICARFHPVKDHRNFLAAAQIIAAQMPQARFVLCGEGITPENPALQAWLAEYELHGRCTLLGRRADMPALLPALDLYVSASRSEAFPVIIGEAMACGVPCVVTRVGDSARIVGETGRAVPAQSPGALAAACLEMLALPPAERQALGRAARARIEAEYNITAVARQYAELYTAVARSRLPAQPLTG
ncbi:MAG: glycosyltransferase [Anaerolineaceae bacterium]|jgi:glycosyltransferase involved in cell wall biosynthesis